MLYKTFKAIRLFAIVAGLLLTLAACGGNAPAATAVPATTDPGTTTTTDATADSSGAGGSADAEAAAKEYVDALFGAGDASPADFVCAAASDPNAMATAQAGYEQMAASFTAANATVDTSGLTFTSETQGDRVIVTVNGNVNFEMAGTTTPLPLTNAMFSFVKEGDDWKIC